jgi:hypothetical protein
MYDAILAPLVFHSFATVVLVGAAVMQALRPAPRVLARSTSIDIPPQPANRAAHNPAADPGDDDYAQAA